MANSLMQIVSDGSLSTIPLTIKFFEQSHIKVFVNNVELPDGTYSYVWSGATTITVVPTVSAGAEVSIRRKTPADTVLHDFQAGAVFSEVSVDENFRQELFLLQEASEQSLVTDLFDDLDMHGNGIRNVRTATLPGDAVNLAQAQFLADGGEADTLRQDLSASDGATIVYTSSGNNVQEELDVLKSSTATGADVPYSPQDRARRQLSASDFTPEATDLGAAVNAVRTSLETEYSPSSSVGIRGGDCFLPRGTHVALTPINLERHSSGTTSFSIRGQGQATTQLDMTSAPAFTDGITGATNGATFGELSDFGVTNAPRSGLRLAKYSRMTFRNMDMRSSGSDGYYLGNGFVAVMEKLTSNFNAAGGFNFDVAVQHTSHAINGGYAFQNGGTGWVFGLMNYCSASALASDNNTLYGYSIARCDGFVLDGCGAESNGRSAFAVLSSTANGSTKNTTINNAFAYHNNLSNAGYPNLLYALAANGEAAHVRISKSKSIPSVGNTTKDIIADGVGAEIEIDDCEIPNGWESHNGGYIHWRHKTLLVRGLTILVAPTATPVCNLRSSQGHVIRYAGEITVLASNIQPSTGERNITIYKLLVCKSIAGGNQVLEISKAGHTTGAGASSPAFTWSLVSDRLAATPLGSAGGVPFWFEIDTASQIVALPL